MQHFLRERRHRAALLFRSNYGGQSAAANVKTASFVAKPGSASAGARDMAFRVASISSRTRSHNQNHAFSIADRGLQSDLKISGHQNRGFWKTALKEYRDAPGYDVAPRASDACANSENVARFQVATLEHQVRRVA